MDLDSNRDGNFDSMSFYQPPLRSWSSVLTAPAAISRLDQDFDGVFEIEIKMSTTAQLLSIAIDSDGDGSFERVLTGDDAAAEMKRIRERNAEILHQ